MKELKGAKLNTKQQAFLIAWKNKVEADIRSRLLKNIQKKTYAEMAGRQSQEIDRFGERYSVPITGPSINLYQAINVLHTRVSELAAIAKPHLDADEAELQKIKLKEEISKLQGQSELLKIEIQTKMAELVKRADVVEKLQWLSGQLQAFGSRLHRVGGPETQLALNEFLESIAVEIDGGQLSV